MSDESDEDVTLAEAIELGAEQAEREQDSFEGEMPDHAHTLLIRKAANLIGTVSNIEITEESDIAEDPEVDEIKEAVGEDAVEIILALGALAYEYDLDLVDRFEDRKEFMELVQDADTMEELMREMDEIDESLVEPGDDVTSDDYDPDDPDRHYQ